MGYEVINEVGNSLRDLIFESFGNGDQLIPSVQKISFSSPEASDPGKLSLFLYQINENIYLKNQEGNSNNFPLFLNLFYLITPHDNNDENNSIIIGKVLQKLHDNPILRGSILPDSIKGDELRLILNNLSLDDLNKIWTIVSGSNQFKFSISLEVTPVRIDSTKDQEIVRVKQHDLGYTLKEDKKDD